MILEIKVSEGEHTFEQTLYSEVSGITSVDGVVPTIRIRLKACAFYSASYFPESPVFAEVITNKGNSGTLYLFWETDSAVLEFDTLHVSSIKVLNSFPLDLLQSH